jgi:HK97 family phage prohead protease
MTVTFIENSFRTINVSNRDGVKAIIGVVEDTEKTAIKEFVFANNWDENKKKSWIENNSKKINPFDMKDSLDCKVLSELEGDDYDLETTAVFKEFSTFEYKKATEEDPVDGIKIGGYLSTFKNMDRYGDIVAKEAFDESIKDIKKKRGGILPMLKDHWSVVDKQAGSWNFFKVDEKGLYVEGIIANSPLNEHLIKLVEGNHINTLSMGGMFVFEDKKGKRFIVKVNLLEGSIVTIPANPKAQFSKKSLFEHEMKSERVSEEKTWEVIKSERMANLEKLSKARR